MSRFLKDQNQVNDWTMVYLIRENIPAMQKLPLPDNPNIVDVNDDSKWKTDEEVRTALGIKDLTGISAFFWLKSSSSKKKHFQLETRARALHESGHTVISYILGSRIRRVDIIPFKYRTGQTLTFRPGFPDERVTPDYIVATFAGPLAEQLLSKYSPKAEPSQADNEQIRVALKKLSPDVAKRRKIRKELKHIAERLVLIEERFIRAFAEILLERKKLAGKEIADILEKLTGIPEPYRNLADFSYPLLPGILNAIGYVSESLFEDVPSNLALDVWIAAKIQEARQAAAQGLTLKQFWAQEKENRKTQAKFVCVKCGWSGNADFVGAFNIKEAGLAFLACSSSSPEVRASCQEPTEATLVQSCA